MRQNTSVTHLKHTKKKTRYSLVELQKLQLSKQTFNLPTQNEENHIENHDTPPANTVSCEITQACSQFESRNVRHSINSASKQRFVRARAAVNKKKKIFCHENHTEATAAVRETG